MMAGTLPTEAEWCRGFEARELPVSTQQRGALTPRHKVLTNTELPGPIINVVKLTQCCDVLVSQK